MPFIEKIRTVRTRFGGGMDGLSRSEQVMRDEGQDMSLCRCMRHPRLYRHADCDGCPPDRDHCVIYHRISSVYRADRLYLYIATRR